ncbi:MAG: hypothetical protein JF585_10865 [Burkholderiales bacterium]|jgi:hypothetical protein|nr:hypothetical protein [Burkholderiales bacterium]
MTTTPPDDVAAMFDLPPLPAEPATEAADALEAAEAELAAGLAATIESGDVAGDAPDSRRGRRVKVSWPARMQLPDGCAIDLTVRDVSEGGVGLMSGEDIPASTVVDFEMGVPPLDEGGRITLVKGTIKTTYAVVHGSVVRCGGTWVQVASADLELLNMWIDRLRR